ncbi:MAG: hypothetical protein KGL39_03630 [Patescibacteria group bacterium]|nr:hypothetical protein [Patescibacteria group bacterium]
MPYQMIRLIPGIDVEQTPTLNQAGWSQSNMIRWFEGLPQKRGGWTQISSNTFSGTARGLHAWADLLGNPYIGIGTNSNLEVFSGGTIYDITPLVHTTDETPDFSTTSTSTTVTIGDTHYTPSIGQEVNINVPVSVGGIVLQGTYAVVSVPTTSTYTITAASAATSDVAHGGAVPSFTTTMGSADVTVTLDDHGLVAGNVFTVQVSTAVGGLTLLGQYTVSSPMTNTFVITAGSLASSGATVSENSGDAQLQYLLAPGEASATVEYGYGVGAYGAGPYGQSDGSSSITLQLRQWFLGNWGQDLVGNPTGGTLYYWVPPYTTGNLATAITGTDVPLTVNSSLVANPQQMMIAFGCDPVGGGTQDPNLVRWSDVGDFTDWLATSSNQAGSFRIPSGSMIVGGITGPQYVLFWTDVDMWQMQYLGAPLVWGFTKIDAAVDLLAARAAGIFESVCVWVSNNNFFMFDGNTVRVIPCPVWDYFFNNLDRTQKDKVFCAINSWFAEATWYFPSTSGSGEVDSYVEYNIRENIWSYGSLSAGAQFVRTSWIDDNVYGAPIGTDTAGNLQQHETATDANGTALGEYVQSGYFEIADGALFTHMDKFIPDFLLTGNTPQVQYEILTQNYPVDTPITWGPFTFTGSSPQYNVLRARGRVAALRVYGSSVGTFWRLGGCRYIGSPAGRR